MLKRASALHTLIPSVILRHHAEGMSPTAERTLNPARMFVESLTPAPELENSLGHSRLSCAGSKLGHVRSALIATQFCSPAK